MTIHIRKLKRLRLPPAKARQLLKVKEITTDVLPLVFAPQLGRSFSVLWKASLHAVHSPVAELHSILLEAWFQGSAIQVCGTHSSSCFCSS